MSAEPPTREQGPRAPCDAWRAVDAIVKPNWWTMAPPAVGCTEIRVDGLDGVATWWVVPTSTVDRLRRALERLHCVVTVEAAPL